MNKILIAILLATVIFVAGCTGGGDTTPPGTELELEEESDSTPAPPPAPTEEEDESGLLAIEEMFSVGETANYSGVEVTLVSAEFVDSYNWHTEQFPEEVYTYTPNPGHENILLWFTIVNRGDSLSDPQGGSKMRVRDDTVGEIDDEMIPELYMGHDALTLFEQLPPGGSAEGQVVFEVPLGSTGLVLTYNYGDALTGDWLVGWDLGR